MIPVTLVLLRLSTPEPLLPILPFLVIGNLDVKLSLPPSPALTLCLLPWTRIIYVRLYKCIKSLVFKRDQPPALPVIPAEDDFIGADEGGDFEDGFVMNGAGNNGGNGNNQVDGGFAERRERKSVPRLVVGALLLPGMTFVATSSRTLCWQHLTMAHIVVASVCGSIISRFAVIRKYVPDIFHQAVLGGGMFIVAKDASDLLYRYLKLRQAKSRRVIDYHD